MTQVEIVTAGHSLQIDGLPGLLKELQSWSELRRITVGRTCGHHKGGRGGSGKRRMAVVRNDQENRPLSVPKVGHAPRRSGGGKRSSIQLKVTGYAKIGNNTIVGIVCRASTASAEQLLTLLPVGSDYQPLLQRLVRERHCTWSDVERW